MDPELLRELLERLGSTDNPLTDEELASVNAEVMAQVQAVDRTNPSDEDLTVLREARTALDAIRAETETREAAAADRAAQAAELLDGLDIPEPAEEPVVEETPADPTAETDPVVEPAEVEPAEPVAEVPVPIAASGDPVFNARPAVAPERPPLNNLARRARAGRNRPQPTATDDAVRPARDTIRASGSMPGITPGQEVDLRQWAEGAAGLWNTLRAIDAPDGEQMIRLGQVRHTYPEEWTLDTNEVNNERKLAAAAASRDLLLAGAAPTLPGARLTASGGICGPVGVDYTVTSIASAVRPARDGLVQMGAARGGLRYIRPHTLADVHTDAPNSIWTAATDLSPGGSTKGRATYVCQTPVEDTVDAIVSRVKLGNFQARYFVEQVDQYMATVEADHARLADGTLLGQILTGSKLVTGALNLTGAASEYFAHLDLALAGYRYRHRMAPDAPMELWLPEWFEDELRADLARELPGNSGGRSERLAVSDAELMAMFAVRNVNVTEFIDNPTGASPAQSWVTQGVGPLLPWPTKVLSFLFHPGAWAFLDGGEFNFGLVRDSTLNNTNDAEFFSETMEKAIFRGHESIALLLDLCPFGGRSGTVDATSLCTSGS